MVCEPALWRNTLARYGVVDVLAIAHLIAFAGLSEGEILAVAEHENIPEAAACSLAEYLSQDVVGETSTLDMIIDNTRAAQVRGDRDQMRELPHVLHHFLRTHPDARPKQHPWSSQF